MQSQRLDHTCRLPVGTRDAAHVHFVVAQWGATAEERRSIYQLEPGSHVKFTDENYTKFVLCDKAEAHGILNPFIDEISCYDNVVVLLNPGITTPVRHSFDINPKQREWERSILESELEERKQEDADCAGCYEIRNNEVIRN